MGVLINPVKTIIIVLNFILILCAACATYLPEGKSTQSNDIKLNSSVAEQENHKHTTDNFHQRIKKMQHVIYGRNRNTPTTMPSHRHHKSYDKISDLTINTGERLKETKNWLSNIKMSDGSLSTTMDTVSLPKRVRRELSDWLIAPNTHWCGSGNTANGTYNYLGGASAADKCCRKHDHCQYNIPGMSKRFELFNYRPYTISHCNCDRRFRTCLKMANDKDATTIGKFFFNMVDTQCFVLRPYMICQEHDGNGKCIHNVKKLKALVKNNRKF